MFFTIVLTVFTVVMIAFGVGVIIWWRKFGKSFFDMAKNLNKMNKSMFNPNNLGKMDNFTEQMKTIQDFLKKKQ